GEDRPLGGDEGRDQPPGEAPRSTLGGRGAVLVVCAHRESLPCGIRRTGPPTSWFRDPLDPGGRQVGTFARSTMSRTMASAAPNSPAWRNDLPSTRWARTGTASPLTSSGTT